MILQAKLFWFLLIGLGASVSSSFNDIKLYEKILVKPKWAPPKWIYGIVWTALYILQGFAAMELQFDSSHGNNGDWSVELTLFVVTFLVECAFMPLFFGLKNLYLGMASMIVNLALSITVTVLFFQAWVVVGWLYLPTTIWIAFATYLFGNILFLNLENKALEERRERYSLFPSLFPKHPRKNMP